MTTTTTQNGNVTTVVTTTTSGTTMTTTTVVTTLTTFAPSNSAAFTFSPSLDGADYTATIKWNIAGQRWYMVLEDGGGNVIVNIPLISSDSTYPVSMVAGYFKDALYYNSSSMQFSVVNTTTTTS